MSKIIELADAYATQMVHSHYHPMMEARAALQAEVEKLEQEHIQRLLRIEQKVDVLIAERDALKAEVDEQREDYLAKCSELEAVHEHYRIITVKLQAELEAVRKDAALLREALEMAIRQNEHDMLLTGEELRKARAAMEATK